ncbi:hypothetical protein [Lacimicrobium alkaliphilum]|uniref:Transposase n=1 Tax=Lacimicrobium alkaliphilum TaxID=1526571 RepID=A0ABQ1RJQ3_9ALTE|nr:hypothetical protein [Lacimicrobium alkaliphilum]GGD72836.1 hypothetical protein GCM10011357_29870 [Lacimicrobium alkaliphilum]
MQQNQSDIFRRDNQQLHYAELCNALYERELPQLTRIANLSLLHRRLKGLSHHIKRAAEEMLKHQGPLQIDIHNASWQCRQSARPPKATDPSRNHQWFGLHGAFGMPVPVCYEHLGLLHLELDSIDRLDPQQSRLHLNKHGWFAFDGHCQQEARAGVQLSLLVPSKTTLSAACCGHVWKHAGKYQPRTLSLRELLLSNKINWKNFKKPL